MTTTVKANCPLHGDIDLTPEQVRLVFSSGAVGYYEFPCADCNDTVRKPADPEIVALLLSAKVPAQRVPAEALEEHGPAWTADEVLELLDEMRAL